ncbi:NAD-dependent epimerase/dehydratase family protein [Hydrogenophaga sp.]|uniref:NAD-dependent epimerase/dehydratase family protein n=1 Tax=Hydrogenophaga sp. TaxID=1904254 RepID=UPI003F6C2C52
MIHYTDLIYVAGHTGMVGAALVRQLIRLGHPRSHIVTRTPAELDLTNQAAVQTFFEQTKPDHVYLPAALHSGLPNQPARLAHHSLLVQANVLDAAFQAGVKKLLLLTGSDSYPSAALQPMAEEDLLTGAPDPRCASTAVTQIAGIKLCESYNQQYGASHGLDYRCAVTCNAYGPGDTYHSDPELAQDPAHGPLIPALIQRLHTAAQQGSPSVVVSGSSTRHEFLFVDDLSEACVYLMELPRAAYAEHTLATRNHINVGFGADVSTQELARTIAGVVGYNGALLFNNGPTDGPARRLLDVSRLKSLGWDPMMDLETGLELSYMDFRLHHLPRPVASAA